MRTNILLFSAFLLLAPAFGHAQPVIRGTNGVVNANSYLPDVAPGSWFVIFGTGLGPSTIAFPNGLPFPASLSGTSITFTPSAGGTPVDALIYYTLATQVAGMVPSSTPVGAYNVTVTYNGQTSAPSLVNVVPRNFGLATQTASGHGPVQATYNGLNLNRFTTTMLGGWSARPAAPGDLMVLWGTGIGADTASDLNGTSSGDQTAAGQVQVIVGGTAVTPLYAGRSPGSPGLDQINFKVPSQITPSCFVSLQVRAGGRLSNLGSIAVAPAGQSACSNAMISESQLQALDTGGSLTVASFHLGKTATSLGSYGTMSQESVGGSFGKYTVDTVGSADFALATAGACFVVTRTGTIDEMSFGVAPTSLDAGAQVTLNGPQASNIAVPRQADNSYNATLYSSGIQGYGGSGKPTLVQGTYTLSGTGGADVGAFSASVDLPGDFVWTNQQTLPPSIPRSSPLTITWTGDSGGLVTIFGAALTQTGGSMLSSTYTSTGFTCLAPGSAGTFTVPAAVLQQLPAVSNNATGTSFGTLSVFAVPDPSTGEGVFTAPLTAGGKIDQGILGFGVGTNMVVGYN